MSTSRTAPTDDAALRALLDRVIDDAAVFPPTSATVADAVAAHPHHRAGGHGALVGRFLCPASRLSELSAAWVREDFLEVGVIADTGPAGLTDALDVLAGDPRLELGAVELAVTAEAVADPTTFAEFLATLPDATAFVELPAEGDWAAVLSAVGAGGRAVKLRTGGTTPGAVPPPERLAEVLMAAVAAQVPIKCTAGLHHAICGVTDDSGNTQHGFLNVALATNAAILGEGAPEVVGWLQEGSPDVICHELRAMHEHEMRRVRASFVGFGSCSITEPVEELRALGLLPAPVPGSSR